MMKVIALSIGLLVSVFSTATVAQNQSWIQIEARPTEAESLGRASDWASFLSDVNSFGLPSGWFAIVIGPYDEATARSELARLRNQGSIPQDSFLSDGVGFGRQIFGSTTAQLQLAPSDDPVAAPILPEETPQQSRASERQLTREQREEIQQALQWDGFYRSAIDASFGPGTRRAMEAWQTANGFEVTGVLSTAQRAQLVETFRAGVAALGLAVVEDREAGIEIALPSALVGFDRYDAPFAHYEPLSDSGVRVLLISQEGDQSTLAGLYDVMQTLEIVPPDGPRNRERRSFSITGANERVVSSTFAQVSRGTIKGFTLVWPAAGDQNQRERVLEAMRSSFRSTGGVIPESASVPISAELRRDLVSGLQVRRPVRARSGYYVDSSGRVLTSADAVQMCGRVAFGDDVTATVVVADDLSGLALLEPTTTLAPLNFAKFRSNLPRLQSEVSVAGYSYGGALTAPTLTFGRIADAVGLNGESGISRLALAAQDGDVGGPVFDQSGAVLGSLLPPQSGSEGRQLPPDVSFAAYGSNVLEFLANHGIAAETDDRPGVMAPEDLTILASDLTVLVTCWN